MVGRGLTIVIAACLVVGRLTGPAIAATAPVPPGVGGYRRPLNSGHVSDYGGTRQGRRGQSFCVVEQVRDRGTRTPRSSATTPAPSGTRNSVRRWWSWSATWRVSYNGRWVNAGRVPLSPPPIANHIS